MMDTMPEDRPWAGDVFFDALEAKGGDPWQHGFYPQCVGASLITVPQELHTALSNGFPQGDGPLLVYPGAFDLWHGGHANAVHAAVDAVNKARLIRPSGVLIVPDSDMYAQQKRPNGDHSGISKRALHITMSGTLDDLPCPWHVTRLGAAYYHTAPNFTHILVEVSKLLRWTGYREIGLIVGQDNAAFAEAVNAVHGFFTVIVQRDDEIEDSDDPKVIIAQVNDSDIRKESSTRVRYRAETVRVRGSAGAITRMRIKDDADMLDDDTRARLLTTISDFYRDTLGVKVTTFRPQDDEKFRVEGAVTVSLDRSVEADRHLSVSRVFADDGKQIEPLFRHVTEPQWEVDPGTDYHLVDDDMDSGGNMQAARDWIESRGGNVVGYTTKTLIGPGEDTIDLSDFTCVEGNGLLIRERDGNLVRVPYLPPRVNLMTRASIPEECFEEFTDAVLDALTAPGE